MTYAKVELKDIIVEDLRIDIDVLFDVDIFSDKFVIKYWEYNHVTNDITLDKVCSDKIDYELEEKINDAVVELFFSPNIQIIADEIFINFEQSQKEENSKDEANL